MKISYNFLLSFIFLICILFPATAFATDRQDYPFLQPFSHYADNEEICSVLANFSRAQGFSSICTVALTGKISGRFEQIQAVDFLEGLRSAFGVRWYEQNQSIVFYHDREQTHAFLSPSVINAEALHNLFQAAQVLSPQLPVRVLHERNLLSLSGPQIYIDSLRIAMKAFEEAQGGRKAMRVFPLRYAWAADVKINSMDSVITIPGVASILNGTISGEKSVSSGTTSITPSAQEHLRGKGLISQGQAKQEGEEKTTNQFGASIIADQRVNAVVITDAEYRMPYYEKVIQELDRPVELVEIHAAIVDIDSDFTRELGINITGMTRIARHTDLGGSAGGGATNVLNPNTAAVGAGLSFSTIYSYGTDFFLGRVNALEEDGAARMLGKPSVLTMDNVQASLENTNTYYIPVAGREASDLFKVEAGTVLKVTPHIIPNISNGVDGIRLSVNIQDNRDDGSDSFSVSQDQLEPIKQTRINTQAIIKEGQSLLIGGYYYEMQSEGDSGVPGLKNIPLLGRLFSSNTKKHRRMERLVLITPRIVRLDQVEEIPNRLDDPRFSRTPSQTSYEERKPLERPVGGCTRRGPSVADYRAEMPEHQQNSGANTKTKAQNKPNAPITKDALGASGENPLSNNSKNANKNDLLYVPINSPVEIFPATQTLPKPRTEIHKSNLELAKVDKINKRTDNSTNNSNKLSANKLYTENFAYVPINSPVEIFPSKQLQIAPKVTKAKTRDTRTTMTSIDFLSNIPYELDQSVRITPVKQLFLPVKASNAL